jgi:hypothetical protein
LTGTIDVNTGVAPQVASLGPKRLNVMVPVAGSVPFRMAVSVIWPPATVSPDAWAVNVGTARVTTTDSPGSAQAPVTGALLASPL